MQIYSYHGSDGIRQHLEVYKYHPGLLMCSHLFVFIGNF